MIDEKLFGKTYPPKRYVVGSEKIKEYCRAIGETSPLCVDEEAAKKGPYGAIVAPPTFAVVYTGEPVAQVLFDKELNINLMMLVHGEQEFVFHQLVKHNDEVISTAKFVRADVRKQNLVITAQVDSAVNGAPVTTAIFTFVVRGGAA
jgi:acyl dehydratase